jgi:hypothetical protein
MSKGGGGGSPSEVTQVTQQLPEYARPYYEQLLTRTIGETTRPYVGYGGQRIAEFTSPELQAMQGIQQLGRPEQITQASQVAAQLTGAPGGPTGAEIVGQFRPQPLQAGYTAGDITSGYTARLPTGTYSAQQFDPTYQAGRFDAGYKAAAPVVDFQAQQFQPQFQATQFTPGYQAQDLQLTGIGQTPATYASQYTGQADLGPGFQAGTVTDTATLQQYMNPYQQLVTDIEKREAARQSAIQGAQLGQQAAQAGALGGYREGVMQSERERNLAQQLQDIQTRGGQAAFQQAQQAFEADRAARLQQAQQELQRGTAGQQFLQQAEQMRQGAFGLSQEALQSGAGLQIQAFQAGEQARQRAAELGLSAQQQEEASRQAQQQFQQEAFRLGQQERQFGAELGLQSYQAGEAARQEAARLGLTAQQQEEAARQAQQQFQQEAFRLGQQDRQFGAEFGLQQYQAGEAARQEAARLGLTAQQQQEAARQAQEQFQQQAYQTNLGAQETAARLGLAGLQSDQAQRAQQLESARLLGGFGAQQQAMDMERLLAQQASGQIGRELTQRGLDIGYEDFLRQQAFPREQLGFLSNILQGLPIAPGSTAATYGIQPSTTQQLLGTGIAGVGLYNALGRGFGG